MDKGIIFCTNIHSPRDWEYAKWNRRLVSDLYSTPDRPVYTVIVSNGLVPSEKDAREGLGDYGAFFKFKDCYNTQLGPTNSVLNCLKKAAELVENPSEYNIIYVHPDLLIWNAHKVNYLMEMYLDSGDYDMVVRNYVGPDWRGPQARETWRGKNYYMTEDFLLSGRVLHRFKELEHEYLKSEDDLICGVHEISFANCIDNVLGLRVYKIDIERNGDMEENEMGFYHDHKH